MISENVRAVRDNIARAAERAGRNPEEIRIVAAAKGQGTEKITEAVAAGISIIGHNYLQEAAAGLESMKAPGVTYHMIGHLQRNKASKAFDLFDVIETVDDARLADALSRRAHAQSKVLGVMIQANLSGESQKSGIPADEVQRLAEYVRGLPAIRLMGLMTMPPFFDEPERARPFFARLRELREKLMSSGVLCADMNELSMGMTGDYEVAVEEGATLVRIGTALFGSRY
ncbi:MAG TPA: YggS family pyridoxal phosphate-dependent enzyme [Desulfomonilaceae bacterium]|nr:YggS family pyridoxal phosphate-dependent enzyme [Desulfomonilaceae bacterium]